jgi:WD40 repeat protein
MMDCAADSSSINELDGRYLAVQARNLSIKVFDVTRNCIQSRVLTGCLKRINDIGFSTDSSKLLTVEDGGTVILWDVGTGSKLWQLAADGIKSARFGAKDSRIITSTSKGAVIINAHDGTVVARFPHFGALSTLPAVLSIEGDRMYAGETIKYEGTMGQRLQGVNILTGQRLRAFPAGESPCTHIVRDPLSNDVVVGYPLKNGFKIGDMDTGFRLKCQTQSTLLDVSYFADGNRIALIVEAREVQIWCTQLGHLISTFVYDRSFDRASVVRVCADVDNVALSSDNSVHILDAATGKKLDAIDGCLASFWNPCQHGPRIGNSLCFSFPPAIDSCLFK